MLANKAKGMRTQTEGEEALMDLKGEISRTPRPKKANLTWISQETWRLAERRAALKRAHQASAREVRQARRSFQRVLRGDRQ